MIADDRIELYADVIKNSLQEYYEEITKSCKEIVPIAAGNLTLAATNYMVFYGYFIWRI